MGGVAFVRASRASSQQLLTNGTHFFERVSGLYEASMSSVFTIRPACKVSCVRGERTRMGAPACPFSIASGANIRGHHGAR